MSEDKTDDFIRRKNHRSVKDRRRWRKKILRKLSREISRAGRKSKTFVISSEHLHSKLLSEEEVADFYAFLAPLFTTITVVCYLRRQDQMAMSRFSQALRAGHVLEHPVRNILDGHKFRLPPYYDFEALLNRWAAAFGEENVLPLVYAKDQLLDGDVVHDFFRAAGLSVHGAVEASTGRANKALSAEAQAVLLGFNRKLPDTISRDTMWRIRDKLVEYLEEHASGESRQLARAEAEEAYAVFEPSNNRVAERWFNRKRLFDNDFSAYPESLSPISVNKVTGLFSGFILEEFSG